MDLSRGTEEVGLDKNNLPSVLSPSQSPTIVANFSNRGQGGFDEPRVAGTAHHRVVKSWWAVSIRLDLVRMVHSSPFARALPLRFSFMTATEIDTEPKFPRVYVVLNPKSGTCDLETARALLWRSFSIVGGRCEIHEPDDFDGLRDLVSQAVRSGVDLVVAAGGDGTVSAVAQVLVGTNTPLGIVPLGTANVLAKELGIPIAIEAAVALLTGSCSLSRIDAMEVNGGHYFTQVGVGIDALMIRDTTTEHKRRFGKAAYLWTALSFLIGFQPQKFTLTVDGKPSRHHASQVVVANCGMLGHPPFRWGPGIRPDDGRLDLCVVRARTAAHYLRLGFDVIRGRHKSNSSVRYAKIAREVTIATKTPLPAQADGEIVGETPTTVRLVQGALRVVVPEFSENGSVSSPRSSFD